MDMASFLKRTANLLAAMGLAKLVAGDLVRRSPYSAAGTAAALGLIVGIRVSKSRRAHAGP
jgi:ElaB/YqjD/DUF883 family membrane-anchored ribosome-binding protein